jgi:hypothetical protein
MKADDFLDAPSADDFLGADEPVRQGPKLPPGPRFGMGRGNAPTRAPLRIESVLQQPGIAEEFASAPDPRANAVALFNALQSNPDAAKSPMYRAGADVLERAATGTPSAVETAVIRNDRSQRLARQKNKLAIAAREQTDQAFGGPVGQAIAAPGRRLAAGVAQVVGGAASIPQLFGSDLGRDTAEAADLMAKANMPEDPGIADEVLSGAGQILPMIGGAAALRAALIPVLGAPAATGVATTVSGGIGGAMSGGEVLRDLEFRGDLSDEDKRRRAGIAALFSGVTGKYADRLLIPGATASSGPLAAGVRAFFGEAAQEGADQGMQNVMTDRPLTQGVRRAALVGGLVGGGTNIAGEVSGPGAQLARAIDADASAFADSPLAPTVWAPTEPRVAPPMAPSPEPAAAPMPALPYNPSPGPGIMVADRQGNARPMTADEFLQAEDTRQEGIDTGLTPDVRRAQQNRSEVTDVEPKPSQDLMDRLIAKGWQPPKEPNVPRETAPAAEADQDAARARPAPAGDAAPDGAADSLRAGEPDAALNPPPAASAAQPLPVKQEQAAVKQEDLAPVVQPAAAPAPSAVDRMNALAQQYKTADEPTRATLRPQMLAANEDVVRELQKPAPTEKAPAESFAGKQLDSAADPEQSPDRRAPVRMERSAPIETESFRKWFRESKAVDEQGRPRVLYHGTNKTQDGDAFTMFDAYSSDYGLFGQGAYFTEDPSVASEYTSKGRGSSPTVYPTYVAVQNPIDMDAEADPQAWSAAYPDIDFDAYHEGGETNESYYRAAEAQLADEGVEKFEGSEAMQDGLRRMGHDGITHIGGGRVKSQGKRHRVYIAFDPEQVKSATGNTGTFDPANPDIRKSEKDQQFRGPAPAATSTSTATTLRTELRSRFGEVIDRLERRGFLKLWDSVDAYNEAGQASKLPADARGVQGMYSRGVAHLFGDGIEPGTAIGVLLHEVGEHASMKKMLGEERYRDLVRRAYRLASDGDEIAMTAMERIPEDTPAKFYDSELLAYMIEETANREQQASPAARSWLRDVITAIRAWFYQTGFAKQLEGYGVKLDLTPKDVAALAERAVRWQAGQDGGKPASGAPVDIELSKKAPTDSEAFRRWFGDSKVVDSKGKPLAVYHGTNADFAEFKGGVAEGIWFAADPEYAGIHGKAVMPVYLKASNPYELTAKQWSSMPPGTLSPDAARARGHDAWVLRDKDGVGDVFVVFEPEQIKSATGNRGAFDPANPDIRFSKKPPVSATGSNPFAGQQFGPQPWTVAEPGTWDNIVRTMQNNKVDLKRVRESIERRFGRIPEAKDAYLQEELYHGKVAARVEKLHTDYVEPLLRKIVVAGKNADVSLADVNLYLHARHAPERNAAMAAINPNTPNNTALSGMSDADAARVLADFGRAGKLPALQTIAKDVDALLADTRTALVADGLEEAGTVQAWEAAYKHYVPLMRDIEDRPAKGSGFSVRGPEAKRATGSNKQVVDILANIVTQAETAAIRAEKAEVGRALLAMAKQYPNADFWTVDTPPTKPRVNQNTGLVERNAVDPNYQTADNVVMVKEYGATRFIVFNKGNERAVQVAKAMKNLEIQQLPKALRYVGAATRFMASLLTQRNPEFWFTNLARDLQGSAIQMNGTEAEGLQGKVLGYLPKALAGMRHVARGTGKNTQWARYAQEMKDAGGTTGYMQIFDNSTERMENLQKEVDRMGQGKADPRRLARSLIEFIDDYNDVIENGMRLAVFQAAREAGVSTTRAASIAKNITVNFNRKGNVSPWVNSLYMFFNAGVQGTARLTEALATSNKARIVVGGLAGAAFVMDIVNRALAGDDDDTKRNRYDLINEFEKSRNWIIMGPDGKYVKVPLPLGFHIFHNAGRLLADAMNRKDPRNAAEYGWAFASTVLDAFNPMGNVASVGQLLAPSVLDPAVQLAENKNFMGGKVYRDADMGFGKTDPRPAYLRYFDTTPDFWKAASKTLNDVSGGDKVKPGAVNIEPDVLRHIYAAITGGPGRALDKSVDTVQATSRGEKITPARIPFAHRFLGEVGDRQKDSAYFEDMKRAAKAKDQFDYFVKAGRRQDALEVLKELGDGDVARGRKVIALFDQAKKDERALNRSIRKLREGDADDTAMQEQLGALKKRRAESRRRVLSNTADPDTE